MPNVQLKLPRRSGLLFDPQRLKRIGVGSIKRAIAHAAAGEGSIIASLIIETLKSTATPQDLGEQATVFMQCTLRVAIAAAMYEHRMEVNGANLPAYAPDQVEAVHLRLDKDEFTQAIIDQIGELTEDYVKTPAALDKPVELMQQVLAAFETAEGEETKTGDRQPIPVHKLKHCFSAAAQQLFSDRFNALAVYLQNPAPDEYAELIAAIESHHQSIRDHWLHEPMMGEDFPVSEIEVPIAAELRDEERRTRSSALGDAKLAILDRCIDQLGPGLNSGPEFYCE